MKPCDRCHRPAELEQLWGRKRDGSQAILIGKLGPRCFYIVAGQIDRQGYQPERFDASIVRLRGRS